MKYVDPSGEWLHIVVGAGHIAGGITAGLLTGQSLEAAFENLFKEIGESMLIGTALGVATTVCVSYAEGINPWSLKTLKFNSI